MRKKSLKTKGLLAMGFKKKGRSPLFDIQKTIKISDRNERRPDGRSCRKGRN